VKGIIVFEGNKFTEWPEEHGQRGEGKEATIKLHPATKPKSWDSTTTKGFGKGETVLAIYELDGDNLKICRSWGSKERPTEFAGKLDGKAALGIYKRAR